MADARKQAVSLRVSTTDLRKVKKLAQRLGVRDSDVIRFTPKTILARLTPLCDNSMRDSALVPVLVEPGGNLFHHFDIDTVRLEEIVNDGAMKEQEVESNDLRRTAIDDTPQIHATLRVNNPPGPTCEPQAPPLNDPLDGQFRSYLYSKYFDVNLTSDPASTQ